MSSSDESVQPDKAALHWDAFEERNVPVEVELVSPAAEAAALLQRVASVVLNAQQGIEEAKNADLQALARQAVLIVQFASALELHKAEFERQSLQKCYRHFRILKDQMLEAIEKAGLQVVIPLGEGFDSIADDVHVIGWRHDTAFESEQVIEVIEPVVRHNERLIHMGRVVMGAPRPLSDEAPTESEGPNSTTPSGDATREAT